MESADAYVIERTIVLDESLSQPRMNWRFCHELAHLLLDHTKSRTIGPEMELEADAYAAELMLPEREFRGRMARVGFAELKAEYPHASWEAVARRWAQFRPAVLTIFDNDQLTLRRGPEGLAYPPHPTRPEYRIARSCSQARKNLIIQDDGLSIQAFFIDEDRGVERVILLTEVQDR